MMAKSLREGSLTKGDYIFRIEELFKSNFGGTAKTDF
jgi:hypothetical protein